MNYTLNQLQVFLKVTETQSVTKAAEALHLTQPAVSIQLKNFQDQFDIPLTEVVGRKIYITEFGKEVAILAQSIIDQINAINYKTLAFKGHLSGRLKISVVSTGKYLMPYFLAPFLQQNVGVDLIMDVTNRVKVLESLERNEVDFSLVSLPPDNLSVESIDLIDNQLYLIGNKELSKHYTGNMAQLFEQFPIIFRENGSGTRKKMEIFLLNQSISIAKKLELTSNEAVKQAVLAGLGFSIMPLIGIKKEVAAGELVILPVKGLPLETKWQLVWPKGKKMSPAAKAFLEFIAKEKQNIISQHFSSIS